MGAGRGYRSGRARQHRHNALLQGHHVPQKRVSTERGLQRGLQTRERKQNLLASPVQMTRPRLQTWLDIRPPRHPNVKGYTASLAK